METMMLYLLRHGESLANVEHLFAARKIDPPLSADGVRQILAQTEALKDVDFDSFYTSPLVRARQSADIVQRQLGITAEETDALREVDVGIFDGRSQKDAQNWSLYKEVLKKWERGLHDVRFPDGESLKDVGARFGQFLRGVEDSGNRRILVLGHCLLFTAVLWLFCDQHGPIFEDGHMGRGCLSILSKAGESLRLLKFNVPPPMSLADQNTPRVKELGR